MKNLFLFVVDTLRLDVFEEWLSHHQELAFVRDGVSLNCWVESLPSCAARNVLHTGRCHWPWHSPSWMSAHPGWSPRSDYPIAGDDLCLSQLLGTRYWRALIADSPILFDPGRNYHRFFDRWINVRGACNDRRGIPDWDGLSEDKRKMILHALGRSSHHAQWPHDARGHWLLRWLWEAERGTDPYSETQEAFMETLDDYEEASQVFRDRRGLAIVVDTFEPHEPRWTWSTEDLAYLLPPLTVNDGERLMGCDWAGWLARYQEIYREVSFTCLDRIACMICEAKKLGDCVVSIVSDHGTHLGDPLNGWIGKDPTRCTDDQMHVPWLVWDSTWSKDPASKPGLMRDGFTQHQDVGPTLLKLLGIDWRWSPGTHPAGRGRVQIDPGAEWARSDATLFDIPAHPRSVIVAGYDETVFYADIVGARADMPWYPILDSTGYKEECVRTIKGESLRSGYPGDRWGDLSPSANQPDIW